MKGAVRILLLAAVVAVGVVAAVAAQGAATGTIKGSVRSSKGAPVAATRVEAASRNNSAYTGAATTDADGNFTLTDVPVGNVTLTVINRQERVVARGNGVIREAGETITVQLQTP